MNYIDMHCDTITGLFKLGEELYDNNMHISLKKLQKSNYAMQCFAIFIYLQQEKEPFIACDKYIDFYYQQIQKNSDLITPVYNCQQLTDNLQQGKLSSLLTIEEGAAIEGDIDKLIHFYNRGVRMMTLTWNYENEIGYPNQMVTPPFYADKQNGLKPFGREVVKKMNELGMIVDVSHGSDKLFYDVIDISDKPIVASHSDSRSICDIPRNLTDEMIKVLADHQGIMGINFAPSFISKDTKVNQIPFIVEHIKHIADVGGIDCIGLGSDFDGIPTPNGMSDCTKMDELFFQLKQAGFSDEDIEKISYKNFLRVFKANCER
ncbi:MAG: dipeptidase [Erysipelotrichia bacterium]|nr:dipeptidase [Erysipelotrichia bacterium]